MWYYCKALERDRAKRTERQRVSSVKNESKRTLKIEQRREKKEPDKIQKEFYLYSYHKMIQTVIAN